MAGKPPSPRTLFWYGVAIAVLWLLSCFAER